MTRNQAENKAKFLNSLVRTPTIEYQVEEVRRRYNEYDEDPQDLFTPEFRVVQVVGGNIRWRTY